MSNRLEVTCINKTDRQNPHERIRSIGGSANGQAWKITQQQAITSIESGQYSFYVHRAGHVVDVIVATHNGNKYIKTKNDGIHPDNLLALPECP